MKLNQNHCLLCSVIAFAIGWFLSKYYHENREHYGVYREWGAVGPNAKAGGQTVGHQGYNNYERLGRFGAMSSDGSKEVACRYGTVTGPYNTAGKGCCRTKDGSSDYKTRCCRKLNDSGGCATWE